MNKSTTKQLFFKMYIPIFYTNNTENKVKYYVFPKWLKKHAPEADTALDARSYLE